MDVNVKETWNRYFLECGNLGSAGGHAQAAARSDRVDHIVTNENASVIDLGGGGQSTGVDKGGRHGVKHRSGNEEQDKTLRAD